VTDNERRVIEKRIGYEFKDKSLVEAAFTHASYVNEHRGVANERLEFLGDCVLDFLVGVELFRSAPDAGEGELTARRASVVSREPLARLVREYGFLELLRVGAGVDRTEFDIKTVSDLYEAVLGAVYLDGGLDAARKFLDKTFFGKVAPERNYKSELQELAAKKKWLDPKYDTVESVGGFITTLSVGGSVYNGTGRSKRLSQIAAARNALDAIVGH
jgi:ribonuclease-3